MNHPIKKLTPIVHSLVLSIFALCFFQLGFTHHSHAQDCVGLIKVNENLGGKNLNSVAYHDGQYLAVGDDGLVLSSTNGEDWVVEDSGTDHHLVDVVWAGDRFAIITYTGIANSTVMSWTSGGGFTTHGGLIHFAHGQALGWDGSKLILAYYDGLSGVGRLVTTTDFVNTSTSDMDLSLHCGEVTDIDIVAGVIAMGVHCSFDGISLEGSLAHSLNGFNLSQESTGPPSSFGAWGLGTNGTIAFASAFTPPVGGNPAQHHFAHTSEIGVVARTIHTTEVPTLRNQMSDADWIGSAFIGVGPAGMIGYSLDGLTWSEIASTNQGRLKRVVPTSSSGFVAVGENETIILGNNDPLPNMLPGWPEDFTCIDLIMAQDDCM